MFCRKCGKEMPEDSVFCGKCGTNQSGDSVNSNKSESKQVDWESVWERAYERAVDRLENGRPGGVTSVVGDRVKISYAFYSGIQAGIAALEEAIEKITPIIEKIEDADEQKEAVEKIKEDATQTVQDIRRHTSSEWSRFQTELRVYNSNVAYGYNSGREVDEARDGYNKAARILEDKIERVVKIVEKRRIDDYWAANKDEKNKLDSELESLNKKIADINQEIEDIKKTDDYIRMEKLRADIRNLETEKSKLGVFKGKQKKEIDARIAPMAKEVNLTQARINTTTKAAEGRITPFQNRINEINNELSKPR